MLFDAWALTTITGKLPGRPPVEPYLHGLTEQNVPETHVAWREDVHLLDHNSVNNSDRAELLLAYPLLARELLREPSNRAYKRLESIGKRHPDHPAWIVNSDGEVDRSRSTSLRRKTTKNASTDVLSYWIREAAA